MSIRWRILFLLITVYKDELTPIGYYDTNGFFVITGHCDKYGEFVEDNELAVNLKN